MLSVGAARRPAAGESVCGDAYCVVRADDAVLVALADGLGHGVEAAEAADAFCRYVEGSATRAITQPLVDLITGAGRELGRTRGVVAAIARVDARGVLEFVGVGNIALKAQTRRTVAPFSMPGILGRPVRGVRAFRFDLDDGDLLVLYSDGLRGPLLLPPSAGADLDTIARTLVDAHGTADDASCMVLRYRLAGEAHHG